MHLYPRALEIAHLTKVARQANTAFDETGPAANKIRRLRRQIAAEDRELQRQQRARSCSIVQQIVREEWAADQAEAKATSAKRSDDFAQKQEPCKASCVRRSAGTKGGVAKLRATLSFDPHAAGRAQKQNVSAKPLRGVASSTARPDEEAAHTKYPPLRKRSLSVFEQKKIEKALQAQQQAILEGTPQRIAGRVYSGPSFRCSPSEVTFKAFEAGRVYTQDVEVTNVSLGFSTFRVLPLPEDVEGIISVAFEAPGRMSAGRSTRIQVTFNPKKEEDLQTEIFLLSPTGPQSLPVICSRKRSVLSFRPHKLSPQALLKSLHTLGAPARGSGAGVCEPSIKKPERENSVISGGEKVRRSRREKASAEKEVKDGILYLSAGDIQLGEVAAVRFRLSNTGSLGTAYRLFPVSPEGQREPLEVDAFSDQRSRQPSDAAASTKDLPEESALEGRSAEDPAVSSPAELSSAENLGDESNACHPREDLRGLTASGWLEALQGEAVVLAQRLRISDNQNTHAWTRILSTGLGSLLESRTERDRLEGSSTAAPLQLSLHSTLVKNAAGELDALQTQEITIVHAPTRTGRFHEDVVVVVDGQCVLPPVCMDAPLHDLGICVPDRGYRQHFQVTSSSTLTRTLQVVSPEVEEGILWVEPRCSFVQPKGVASLTAHLCLSFAFFDRHPEYVQPLPPSIAKTNLKSVAFKIPIQIRASDQILCAETAITGVLTELHLRLSRSALNFGRSENTTRRMQLIKVHNPSLLIASFGFRSSDRALRVLEPPHFSDLNGGINRQQTSKNSQDNHLPAPGINCSVPPQDLSGAVEPANDPVSKEETATPQCSSDLPEIPVGDWQETQTLPPFLALRQPQETDSKTWDDLHQYLPRLDCGGTGMLLPGETRTFAVVLDPTELRFDAHALQLATGKAVEREGELRMRVLLASQAAYEVKIPWSVTLVESPVAILPAPTLMFPTIPVGQRSSATLELKLLASQLALGRVDIDGSPKQSTFPESSIKENTQFTAALVEVQQPPLSLSGLSITPTRILLYSKRRCASLFICFNPTNEYMQVLQQAPPAGEAQEADSDVGKSPPLPNVEETARTGPQQAGGTQNGEKSPSQATASSGSAKGREGAKKSVKADGVSPVDSKAATEKRPQKDAKPKQTKPSLKSGGSIGEEEAASVYPSEDNAEAAGNGNSVGTASATEGCNDATAPVRERSNGTAIRATLLNMAKAGGARWTSLEEDGGGDFFAFDDPRAFHHSRWLIPLKIWRLTPKQVDAFLVGKEMDPPHLSVCETSQSFIEKFVADLTLQSARTRITIPLSGSGIQQTVDVVPFQTAYDMGAVLCTPQVKGATCASSTSYTVSLRNKTSTPLAFTLAPKQSLYPQLDCAKAGTGLNCFSCDLQQGVILGLSSVELVFHFRPQRPEGWLRGDFELTLATDGHASRVLSFFGLATANPIYVTLPSQRGESVCPPREATACSLHEGSSRHSSSSKCCCNGSVESKDFEEALRLGNTCLACCMELLPRLSAERSLLCPEELDSPWNRTVADEGNPTPKGKGQNLPHQQAQQAGSDSGSEKKRGELQQSQQVLHVRFGPSSRGGCLEEPDECPSRTQGDKSVRDSGNQKQPTRSPPQSGRDEKPKGDTGPPKEDADLIIENDVTRTIVVAGAWSPGRQGLPPYASVKGKPQQMVRGLACSFVSDGHIINANLLTTEERIRDVLSHLPTDILKQQEATATARLLYRGATGGGSPQSQEVAVIRLSAPL
ncbi:hypothetical protein, conserved [Eimeria brunetti]|uniref:Flagellar associated, related protein n=1 Tax=Eimeria brunetti TaxID=51314 RepID=U6LKP1_9EIME|nr:hypothetical protein, conserved [Eimeria brunetti]